MAKEKEAESPTGDEDMKQKYMQFQLINQQLEQVSQHLEMLNQQNAELEISIGAVGELGKAKVNDEVLAPIANGIFFKSELKDNKKLVVNVGSNITTEKTIDEVVNSIEDLKAFTGKVFLEIKVKKGFRKDLGRPTTTPKENKQNLMEFIKEDYYG